MASPKFQDADLSASNLKLLETGNFADAKIICGNQIFKIHKSVVCTRSVWFEKALAGGFDVRISHPNEPDASGLVLILVLVQEATTGEVKLCEQDPEAIGVILKYIYGGGEYADDCTS